MKKLIIYIALMTLIFSASAIRADETKTDGLKEIILSQNNFENASFCYVLDGAGEGLENAVVNDGGDVVLTGSDFSAQQNNAARIMTVEAPESDDGADRGTVLLIEKDDSFSAGNSKPTYLSYNGETYMPAKKGYAIGAGQRILIEFDMYVEGKAANAGNLTFYGSLWPNPTTKSEEQSFCSFANTGAFSLGGTSEFSWQDKTWHRVRSYVDLENKAMDVTIDGEALLSDFPLNLSAKFDSTGVAAIKFTIGFKGSQKLYMDNIKLSVLVAPPRITDLKFIGSDGTVSDTAKGYDTSSVIINCSEKIVYESLAGHLKLVWADGEVYREIPFELITPTSGASQFTLNLKAPLRENARCILSADSGFTDVNGNVNENIQTIEFETPPPLAYVKSIVQSDSQTDLTFVNSSGDELSLKAVIAVYEGESLKYMRFKNLVMPEGESSFVIDTSVSVGGEKRVYICNSQFVPYYVQK